MRGINIVRVTVEAFFAFIIGIIPFAILFEFILGNTNDSYLNSIMIIYYLTFIFGIIPWMICSIISGIIIIRKFETLPQRIIASVLAIVSISIVIAIIAKLMNFKDLLLFPILGFIPTLISAAILIYRTRNIKAI